MRQAGWLRADDDGSGVSQGAAGLCLTLAARLY